MCSILETSIAGVHMTVPIYNASGCWCTSYDELDELDSSNAGAIISKSSTYQSREGNPEPRRYLDKDGSINSMGVPNHGYLYYAKYEKSKKPYFQSVIPFSLDELVEILTFLNSKERLVEVNLSCPNIINKTIVGYDFPVFDKYLNTIQGLKLNNLTIGIKLPPYYEMASFERVSEIILRYTDTVKFITCINSVVDGLIIDENDQTAISPKCGFGGIGGLYCKPTALANVHRFYKLLGDKVDIIGCGGVRTGRDVYEHILCGAVAVQVGTNLVREGPSIFTRLNRELIEEMLSKGYNKLTDFRGKLQTKQAFIKNYEESA